MGADDRLGPETSLSAARLTLAVKRARAEAGASFGLVLSEPVAIVGMACRFPGAASTPEAFWKLLMEGKSGIRSMPEDRWKGARAGLAPHLLMGGYLEEVDLFDAEFFGIAPREAHSIDPQQRLLLEVCWEALSDAGIAPSALNETSTGAFIAIYNGDYLRMQFDKDAVIDAHTGVGAAHSVAAGRLSFLLNLRGPSLAVDTACSSSLVATHLAMRSLRSRECNVALVGASSLKLLPDEVRTFAQWGMLSHDGRAKTFDAAADGFVPGEGSAMIVLKRLSDAIAQGDMIRGVLRGSAVNHDGRSSVLTAPSGPAQEAVIREALQDGHLEAGDVSYVETHGTGTSLGDPIEVEALDAVYGASTTTRRNGVPCVLGAVKTNVGHLEACAGLAGLIKVVLALEHEVIPRNLNFQTLNPQIRLDAQSRLRLATDASPWPRTATPRYAGVSSFGLGGTNAHLVLEEAPAMPRLTSASASSAEQEYCLAISAHTLESLGRVCAGYGEVLRQPGCELSELAAAAARHRDHGLFRIVVTASTAGEAEQKLERRFADKWSKDRAVAPELRSAQAMEGIRTRKIAFVFSGQGSVWKGMLNDLLRVPEAARVFGACEEMVQRDAGWSLRDAAANESMLADTVRSQAVLFATQMALVEVLKSWGITPEAAAGHSVGEIAAAVTCGALSLEQGLGLALQRGRHMGMQPGAEAGSITEAGRMLAVEMSAQEAAEFLRAAPPTLAATPVEIAAMNSPKATVLSGTRAQLSGMANALRERGTASRWLDVEYAFHSAAMEPAAGALTAELGSGGFRAGTPRILLVSTVTGRLWEEGDGSAAYWGRGVRQPVRFEDAVEQLLGLGCESFVEVGPHPVLLRAVTEVAAASGEYAAVINTVAVMRRGHSARSSLMQAAAALYEDGADLRWRAVYPGASRRAALPPYPWNRERFWLQEPVRRLEAPAAGAAAHMTEGGYLPGEEVSSAFAEMRIWQRDWSVESTGWVADHCWRGKPILPFAAWMEIARQAAAAYSGTAAGSELRLTSFVVHQPLTFATELVAIQTLATARKELRIAARTDGRWSEFASGSWESGGEVEGKQQSDRGIGQDGERLAGWRRRCPQAVPVSRLYEQLAERGLTYGKAFRILREVHRGPHAALGEIVLPTERMEPAAMTVPGLQPVLLDACLQLLQAAMAEEQHASAVLPVSVRSYNVLRSTSRVYALAEILREDADGCEADVTIADEEGKVVAEVRGLQVRRVPNSVSVATRAPMWKMAWLPETMPETMPETLVEAARDVQTDLRSAQQMPWVLLDLEEESSAGMRHGADFMQKLAGELSSTPGVRVDLVRGLALDARPASIVLAGARDAVTEQMLAIVAHEQQRPGSVRQVCVVTQEAIDTGRGERIVAEQSALLGLIRSFRAEFPMVRVAIVDLQAGLQGDDLRVASKLNAAGAVGIVAERLVRLKGSEELALRGGRWLRPRLMHSEPSVPVDARELVIGRPGLLESLHEESYSTAEPADDEVQIAVHTHGLNFRDVLTAMGNYAGVAGALGAECAGVVVKAGSRSGFDVGTSVLAFAPASMRSLVNVPASYVAAKQSGLTFAEAASVPVAFLTAHHAFSRLAMLKPGDTVLIHSAAGGLGQAAVQLARLAGAAVIATAGSAERRAYLEAQGIPSVFDSRSEAFAVDVLRVTGGRGVDVVLNALSGSRIAAGFRALREGGVFLEVGKRDILSPAEAAALRPDARYHAFDLGEVAQRDPELIAQMLRELMGWFAGRKLTPLPLQGYALDEAEEAFRTMAGARHMGKLVLNRPAAELADPGWTARWSRALQDGTMLITGGTGALGMATAEWLLGQGARSLVLVSRGGGAGDAIEKLTRGSAGKPVQIVVERADVADMRQMEAVLTRVRDRGYGALRGVFHAAGEAQDRLLADHTMESFARGLRTKVEGARALDLLTRNENLLATVYFSSVASLLGSAGQASYAAANACLDGMAAERNARGLRTLSVNWGAWGAGGMVERLSEGSAQRLSRNGARPMQPAAALAALGEALAGWNATVTIADIDWASAADQFAAGSPAAEYLRRVLPSSPLPFSADADRNEAGRPAARADRAAEEMQLIRAASKSERVLLMETFVRAAARKVLGLSAGRPMPAASPLQELGLDSLMALELRNVLSQAIGQPLSATLLFDSPSIRELSVHLLSRMQAEQVDLSSRLERPDSKEGHAEEIDLDAMSESEAEALLLAELDLAEGGRTRG